MVTIGQKRQTEATRVGGGMDANILSDGKTRVGLREVQGIITGQEQQFCANQSTRSSIKNTYDGWVVKICLRVAIFTIAKNRQPNFVLVGPQTSVSHFSTYNMTGIGGRWQQETTQPTATSINVILHGV